MIRNIIDELIYGATLIAIIIASLISIYGIWNGPTGLILWLIAALRAAAVWAGAPL